MGFSRIVRIVMEDKESSKNGYQLNGEGHIQSGQGQVKQKDTAA